MKTFAELATSRRGWIETTLKPWCHQAPRRELTAAHQEWIDIGGRADPERTLWPWAWARFPVLFVDDLGGIEEAYPVVVTLRDGTCYAGFPDGRRSRQGDLVLIGRRTPEGNVEHGPFSIDDIERVERAAEDR